MRTPKELFSEIVKLASSIGQVEEVQEEVVLSEQVDLEDSIKEVEAQVELAEEVTEEVTEEAPIVTDEEPSQELAGDFVTRAEYNAALNELKEMYSKVLEVVSPSSPQDVPAELSSDKVELSEEEAAPAVEAEAAPVVEEAVTETEAPAEVEVRTEEPAADDLVHTPDAQMEEKQTYLYAQGRPMMTSDHVFKSLFNK